MVTIKDEIHGNVEISELEAKIIDSEEFQRLRSIKQMAFTYLVYPGANHTRFEHSIGVTHLASIACEKLGFDNETTEKVRLYALLHDIGHVPFSHELEKTLKKYIGNHEEIGNKKIIGSELKDIIGERFDAKEIVAMENTPEGKVVSSDLGVDRMDYLVRDAQNTGVAYGVIDSERIIHTLELRNGELMINEGGLEAAESLLIARFMMFSTVYLHKTVRIAAAMFQRGVEKAIEAGEVAPEDFLEIGDDEALALLKNKTSSSEYIRRLMKRKLYKQAYALDSERFAKIKNKMGALEREISEKTGCEVILEYPSGFFKPVDFKVDIDGKLIPIGKASELVSALRISEEKRRKLMVLCPEEKREIVKKAAEKAFGK
ncbi:MAG: HD domain-containing protein [Candidatus Micrarchaeia archaeon]